MNFSLSKCYSQLDTFVYATGIDDYYQLVRKDSTYIDSRLFIAISSEIENVEVFEDFFFPLEKIAKLKYRPNPSLGIGTGKSRRMKGELFVGHYDELYLLKKKDSCELNISIDALKIKLAHREKHTAFTKVRIYHFLSEPLPKDSLDIEASDISRNCSLSGHSKYLGRYRCLTNEVKFGLSYIKKYEDGFEVFYFLPNGLFYKVDFELTNYRFNKKIKNYISIEEIQNLLYEHFELHIIGGQIVSCGNGGDFFNSQTEGSSVIISP